MTGNDRKWQEKRKNSPCYPAMQAPPDQPAELLKQDANALPFPYLPKSFPRPTCLSHPQSAIPAQAAIQVSSLSAILTKTGHFHAHMCPKGHRHSHLPPVIPAQAGIQGHEVSDRICNSTTRTETPPADICPLPGLPPHLYHTQRCFIW